VTVLLLLVETHRVYPPDIVAAMAAAFDTVCQSLSARVSGNDDVRRQLARIILRHTDRGEQDPERHSERALRELAGLELAAVRSKTGRHACSRNFG
jgi:hypothetical protein